MIDQEKLAAVIEQTVLFHQGVAEHFSVLTPASGGRYGVAFQAAILSIDHSAAIVILISADLSAPAFALMRAQYESLVRGIWLLYAANELWVEKISEPLTLESARRADEGPGLADMLKQLDQSATSPKPIISQLKDYKDMTWKAMNSYTHGGLHPLARTVTGYPAQLSIDALRNSNAVLHLTCQLGAILTGDPSAMIPVWNLANEFRDCLPILNRA